MRSQSLSLPILLSSVLALASCGGGGGGGGGDDGPVATDVTLQPDPAGILMPGEDDQRAVDVMPRLLPSAVDPVAIQEDGFLRTRMEALLDLDATVGEVNAALEAQGLRIVSMEPALPVLTLVAPDSSPSTMRARAEALQDSSAFSRVTPSYAAFDPRVALASVHEDPDLKVRELRAPLQQAGDILPEPSLPIRLPAAHLAKALAYEGIGPMLPVLVPGHYGRPDPDPRVSAMTMRNRYGIDSPFTPNDGFIDAAMIGWDFPGGDDQLPAHPTANEHLDIRGRQIAGLTWSERVREIADMIPANRPSVLFTGLVYQPDFDARSRFWRALDALMWRASLQHQEFVHVTAAGETDFNTPFNSPFEVSKTYPDVEIFLHSFDPGFEEEEALLQQLAERLGDQGTTSTFNTRIVGGTDYPMIAPLTTAAKTADMLAVGVARAPCFVLGDDCYAPGYSDVRSSTRIAAAQVAGLAAYLWTLAPTLSAQDILAALDAGWEQGEDSLGVIDAYAATLALDESLLDAPVRRTILDVTNPAGEDGPDGVFDEWDLERFLTILTGEQNPGNTHYDLNGDGDTGDGSPAQLDLDGDRQLGSTMQGLETILETFDETGVTDLDVLRYYAYSPLYQGDSQARASLLAGHNGLGAATLTPSEDGNKRGIEVDCFITPQGSGSSVETTNMVFDEQVETGLDSLAGLTEVYADMSSNVLLGPGGNLVGLSSQGTCTSNLSVSDVSATAFAESNGAEFLSFYASGPVDLELNLVYQADATELAEATVTVILLEGVAFQLFEENVLVQGDSQKGVVSLSETLPELSEGEGYRLGVFLSAEVTEEFDEPSVQEASLDWALEVTISS